jgi:enoyl-CoA hydratase
MQYETLELNREGPVLWCTLNRPDSLNALNPRLVDDLRALLTALAGEPGTRVVVLRGAGRGFCAGLDLKEGAGGDVSDGGVSAALRGQRYSSRACTARPAVAVSCWPWPRTCASRASPRA